MVRTILAWSLMAGLLLSISGCKKEFSKFASKKGRFEIMFPGKPKEQTKSIVGTTLYAYAVEERNGAYMAAYADLPIPRGASERELQSRLDGSRQGMIRNVNGTLENETKIRLDGKYPGREITARFPMKNGRIVARIYIVNGRLYQVMILGTKSWVASAKKSKFLDSFKLTGSGK